MKAKRITELVERLRELKVKAEKKEEARILAKQEIEKKGVRIWELVERLIELLRRLRRLRRAWRREESTP